MKLTRVETDRLRYAGDKRDDLIDEAVWESAAHVERMNDRCFWMRVGVDVLWIFVERGKLYIGLRRDEAK